MTQRQSFGVLVAHALIALALIISASVLAALHVLDASAVTAIFGAVLGFAGGAGIAQGAAIINGGPKPDLTKLAATDPEAVARLLGKQSIMPNGSTVIGAQTAQVSDPSEQDSPSGTRRA